MTTSELRAAFLRYFAEQNHQIVKSAPLVPGNDPTLLFTNAGMVQFKDVFLGEEQRSYQRAVTAQRCVRAGGKHNDLENVGYTARHHTFFEMLGNFSFGDYFKEDAIKFAWTFITETLGLPAERLWVTVFREDDEAEHIWKEVVGIDPERFSKMGEKDNFWQMGDTGPCGPCSEIFFDHGPDVAGGPPGSPDEDGDRYIEIWNLVFMQYDRSADGTLTQLPKPSVDTGMGLERVAAVMQGVHSNYEIDLFASLIGAVATATRCEDMANKSLRVIADHIRACAFLIVDGVLPGRDGRSYVLRRIIRRAVRHGYMLGMTQPFFHRLVQPLIAVMGEAYPELVEQQAHVERILLKEESRFAETLTQGMSLLNESIATLDGKTIPGDVAFRLYDTYGFPLDLTADVAREHGLNVDTGGFEAAMAKQREQAKAASQFKAEAQAGVRPTTTSEFIGYEKTAESSVVTEIFVNGDAVDTVAAGTDAVVILAATPFYAESGGQVGDTGQIVGQHGAFRVTDTTKAGAAHAHIGQIVEGSLTVGDSVCCEIDHERRDAIRGNHTATHLLHAALREVLGTHVTQKGSLVNAEKLRFDFSHYDPVSLEQIQAIEDRVNQEIRANHEAITQLMDFDAAVESGAMALFGEKYDDKVRVLTLGDFSVELCGGTHVARTGDIGFFKIITETGIAAGTRRIEAVSGVGAERFVRDGEQLIAAVGNLLKGTRSNALEKVQQLQSKLKDVEKELAQTRQKLATGGAGSDPLADAVSIGDARVLAVRLDGIDPATLRHSVDQFRDRLGRGVVVIGSAEGDKVRLAAGVSKDLTNSVKAGDLIGDIAALVGGKGGGRPDFAQAGGTKASQLSDALAAVVPWVQSKLDNN